MDTILEKKKTPFSTKELALRSVCPGPNTVAGGTATEEPDGSPSSAPFPPPKGGDTHESGAELAYHVLVMDDEDAIRSVLGRMLRVFGCTVAFARDGSEAVEVFTAAWEDHAPFDVVFLDLTVPSGMGGLEALQKILVCAPSTRAIAMSGYATDAVMSAPHEAGFTAALCKPFRLHTLKTTLEQVAGRRYR